MNVQWTIDTYVLHKVAEVDLDASTLILNILLRQDKVVLDYEGHIVTEYKKCLFKTNNELLQRWFIQIVSKSALWFSSKGLIEHKQYLENKLDFHKDDWPFVAVCSKSKSKMLVSEESDYTNKVKEYLCNKMKVSVLSIKESLNIQ